MHVCVERPVSINDKFFEIKSLENNHISLTNSSVINAKFVTPRWTYFFFFILD